MTPELDASSNIYASNDKKTPFTKKRSLTHTLKRGKMGIQSHYHMAILSIPKRGELLP